MPVEESGNMLILVDARGAGRGQRASCGTLLAAPYKMGSIFEGERTRPGESTHHR